MVNVRSKKIGGDRRNGIRPEPLNPDAVTTTEESSDVLTPEQRRMVMRRIKSKGTKPEMLMRRVLYRCGLRYRLHRSDLPGCPDIVFPKYRTVVFVNGCFWHGHGCSLFKWPTTRAAFWQNKINRTRERDRITSDALRAAGWRMLVVWECAMKGKHRIALGDIQRVAESFIRYGKADLLEIAESDKSAGL